jgi:tetratricopeptide (TPR) repeat protein
MSGRVEKTVFISYRRTNFYTALAVYQDLTAHGYDVFFDYESIDSGDFETVIFENIRFRAHFVVILSPSALERLGEKNSVMRREVELAIDEKRNIIPLMMESFDFGSPSAKEALTGKLESLSSYNGLKFVPEYIFAGMEKLRRFLNVELEAMRQPALSAVVEENTEKRQVKAKEEPVVQEESLTAEELFESAYTFQENKNYEEAIRYYQKALELESDLDAALNNSGNIFSDLKRYDEAEAAYRKAIELNPEYATAYSNLGNLLSDEHFKI